MEDEEELVDQYASCAHDDVAQLLLEKGVDQHCTGLVLYFHND